MTVKQIAFAVMCVLLVVVLVMACVVASRVGALMGGVNPTLGGTAPSAEATTNTQSPTGSADPTVPQPTVPTVSDGTTAPTEPGHVHEYTLTETMEASCENYGYKIYTCATCGKQDIPSDELVDPYGHNFGAGMMVEATCTEDGYTRYTCSRCGKEEDRNIKPALGHVWVLIQTVPAACEQEGYDLYACSACGTEEKKNVTPAVEHSNILVESADPGCTDAGYEKYCCELCRKENLVSVPAVGHTWGEWIVQADGSIARVCGNCGNSQSSMDMAVTGTQVSVEDGAVCKIYVISVGTAETPNVLHYTVYDYRNRDVPQYRFDPVCGLVVTYLSTTGEEEQIIIAFLASEPTVLAGG